jgi:sulfur-oxidizing protein SoxX
VNSGIGVARLPALPLALLLAGLLAFAAAAAPAQGDAARGAALAASRSQGLCLLCHALPGQPAPLQGTIGPALAGVGARLVAADLRQRLLEPERQNPDTVMPSYGRTQGLQRVAVAVQGRPLLTPAQIDDMVAYLVSLQ